MSLSASSLQVVINKQSAMRMNEQIAMAMPPRVEDYATELGIRTSF